MLFKNRSKMKPPHRVVIVGGGFGGLYAALNLGRSDVRVTLIDKRNFHLFQPLLYQVATGGLSPGDIASPFRAVLSRYPNVTVLHAQVTGIDAAAKLVLTQHGPIPFDSLIVAAGAEHHYFGNEHWQEEAPALKSVEDALKMRRKILLAFEAAELAPNNPAREALLRFVVVGGGPTGVELAGALAELAHKTMARDFRRIDPRQSEILLLEGAARILPGYPESLSAKARMQLQKLGVTVRTGTFLTGLEGDRLTLRRGDTEYELRANTVLWAAGIRASGLGKIVAQQTGAELDRQGRVRVEPDLSLAGHPDIFVIGDSAHTRGEDGAPLPGVAPVAMQQGRYVARLLKNRLRGKQVAPFRYRDKGSLAVIGRNAAVADFGKLRFSGFVAWLLWALVHIRYLIEFDNKVLVLFQWAWNYFTRNRGARIITNSGDPEQATKPAAPPNQQSSEIVAGSKSTWQVLPDQFN